MGGDLNFKNFGNAGIAGGAPPLSRQPSVYSLTFDEFQTAAGKDFGSMNMDELLKSIWSAEDNHSFGYLQKQGSMILPRTISQKSVDEVWKDMSKEYEEGRENDSNVGFGVPNRQQTLGEITLEEFLFRAGAVREEPHNNNNNNVGIFGDFWHPVTATTNVNGVRLDTKNQPLQQHILPKQPASVSVYGSRMGMNTNNGSPTGNYSSDGLTVSNGDMSPISPVPLALNGGLRCRRSDAVEKVVERRQRRMIKNRESAARSRARKQAYTTELEKEVAKLKEKHEKLQKKQAEIMEIQKNQVLEMMKQQNGSSKRQCLRRTQTGPW